MEEPIFWAAKAGCRLSSSSEPLKEESLGQGWIEPILGATTASYCLGPSSEPLKEPNQGLRSDQIKTKKVTRPNSDSLKENLREG
jgi:hypothetical protein